jgi:hypothetical protein
MHDIEPHYHWLDYYNAAEDKRSPFYGRTYDAFYFTQKVYNYYVHPQWDAFGSNTLYCKILFVDYEESYAIIEFIGEWNDCLYGDIEAFKRSVINHLIDKGVCFFILICENVYNFHGDDDSYYEEWWEDICDEGGWICMINTEKHLNDELNATHIYRYIHYGPSLSHFVWRPHKPEWVFQKVQNHLLHQTKGIDG